MAQEQTQAERYARGLLTEVETLAANRGGTGAASIRANHEQAAKSEATA